MSWLTHGFHQHHRQSRCYHDVFTVTAPDGTKTTWNQNSELETAATWYDYTLTQLGTYTFSGYDTGCYFNGSDVPVGIVFITDNLSILFTCICTTNNVTCQANLVSSWPSDQIQASSTLILDSTSRLFTHDLVARPRELSSILRWNNRPNLEHRLPKH